VTIAEQAPAPPRAVAADIQRSMPFTFTRAADGEAGDGLTLRGHAAVFNQPTEIDSWEGRFLEQVRPGAFKKSIRSRTPVLQFEHGRHNLIGSMPIGRIDDLREDDQGLYVEARLSDNWLIEPVRDAIRDEAVTGMSFRFGVIRDQWTDAQGKVIRDDAELLDLLWYPEREGNVERQPLTRELIEVRVAELGPVVFPAYEGTSVSVRAASIASTVRSDEALLHRVQRGLALAERSAPEAVPDRDPDLLREVAIAALWPDAVHTQSTPPVRSAAPPLPPLRPTETPDPDNRSGVSATRPSQLVDLDALRASVSKTGTTSTNSTTERAEDAPAAGHPSTPASTTDAPAPSHPSPTSDQDARQQYARRAYVTTHSVGKRRYE
jgi:HK97 family phage prohead protease